MDRRRIVGFSLVLACLTAFVLVLFAFWKLLAPFILSYILYFILKPVLNLLEQRGVSHVPAVCLVFFSILGGFILLLAFFIPALYGELLNIKDNLQSYAGTISSFLTSIRSFLTAMPFGSYILDRGVGFLSPSSEQVSVLVQIITQKIPSFLSTLLLFVLVVPFATFFFLLDGRRISQYLISLVPNRFFETTLNLFYQLNLQFSLILKGMLISVFIISLLSSAGLWLINLQFPFLIGVFAGVSNLIPYAGPIVGIVGAFLAAVMTGASNSMFFSILVVFALVQVIDNVFVQPLVMAKSSNLHPLLVLFFVLSGSSFGGVIGMLIVVPLVSLSLVVFRILFSELNRPPRPAFSTFRDVTPSKECP